jgi:hypothetical protein
MESDFPSWLFNGFLPPLAQGYHPEVSMSKERQDMESSGHETGRRFVMALRAEGFPPTNE